MKKLNFTLHATWMGIALLSTSSMQGMKNYAQLALQTNELSCPLNTLIAENLLSIFSYCLEQDENQELSLRRSIKALLKLKRTCTSFNTLLTPENIGALFKNYTQKDKNMVLYFLMKETTASTFTCEIVRLPLLTLIYAGANVNCYPSTSNDFLRRATSENYLPMVEILTKYIVQ